MVFIPWLMPGFERALSGYHQPEYHFLGMA